MFELDHVSEAIEEPTFLKVTNKIKSMMQIVDNQNKVLMGREDDN